MLYILPGNIISARKFPPKFAALFLTKSKHLLHFTNALCPVYLRAKLVARNTVS